MSCNCHEHHCDHCHHEESNKKLIFRLVFGGLLFFSGLFCKNIYIYIISYLILGYDVIINALKSIRNLFNESFLMTLATLGAFFIGEYPETVAVMLFYQIGELLSHTAEGKSKRSIEALMDLRSDVAKVKRDGKFITLPCEEIKIGEIILVSSGERVPLDGTIVKGSAYFDFLALTGEAKPVQLCQNQKVMSGVINLDSAVEIVTSGTYSESTVAKILKLVKTHNKSNSEKFITKFAKIYTPIVVIFALLVALVGSIVTQDTSRWIYSSLVFLVVSCPCALVVSVPLTFFAGIGRASKEGILVKGGYALEKLSKIKQIAFDKTGTLTKGEFSVQEISSDNDSILKNAAYAEALSSHPIAKAITRKYGKEVDFSEISDFTEIAGKGVSASIYGKKVIVGSKSYFESLGYFIEDDIKNAVFIAIDDIYSGYIIVSDSAKPEVEASFQALKKMKIKTTVLTGDSFENTKPLAERINTDFFAELLPQDKVKALNNLQKNGLCAFVGDGINDAPVISNADVGISMGGLGSDAAIEASDIVIMNDDISKIPKAINISKKTISIAKENIFLALGIKIIIMILGLFGITTMWLSVFADVGVCLLAVLNSVRALRIR